jgi:peptidyl-tRNA hydrolase
MVSTSVDEWRPAVAAWDGSRIRKVVRRARGAAWRAASALPGLTVVHRSAEVRVYPPIPLDGWPPELARLQVGGTDLTDPQPPPAPAAPLVLLNPDVPMTAGKAMAQAGHAVQLGWRRSNAQRRADWQAAGFPVSVREARPQQWEAALRSGAPVVHDAGFTEVSPGTATAVFVGWSCQISDS